jgi:hypothetical protein
MMFVRRDECPACRGELRITTATSFLWRARCRDCHRYARLDDRFRWTTAGLEVWPFLLVAVWLLLIVAAAWVDAQ